MRNHQLHLLFASAFALFAACAPDLTLDNDDEDQGIAFDAGTFDGSLDVPPVTGNFTHAPDGEGVQSNVDATSTDALQYIDLDTGEATDDPERWDIAFRRFFVVMNGGLTGNGGVSATVVESVLSEVESAPENGYTTAVADTDGDPDMEPNTPFNNGVDDWYDYDINTHTLTAKERTYVVVTTEGAFVGLQILDYYNEAGTPARVSFRWRLLEGGEPPVVVVDPPVDGGVVDAGPVDEGVVIPDDALTVDASTRSDFLYYAVSGTELTAASADDAWDIAFRRTDVRTNSGTSGDGYGGAKSLGDVEYDDVTSTDTFGFERDEVVLSGRPGAEATSVSDVLSRWYDYNFMFHTVSPKAEVFVLRTAAGAYFKFRIWSWDDGTYRLSIDPITALTETRTLTLDTNAEDGWTDLSLEGGHVVTVEDDGEGSDEVEAPAWDLAVLGTQWRTNGGTSGDGRAAAATSEVAIDALSDVNADFVLDREITGGGESYSGSPAFAEWFEMDPETNAISSRQQTYLVRTRHGDLGALRIEGYEDGVYTLTIRYAGAGAEAFE
ncbi:MAG: HmuY family protein [Myxococcota bacterium]